MNSGSEFDREKCQDDKRSAGKKMKGLCFASCCFIMHDVTADDYEFDTGECG